MWNDYMIQIMQHIPSLHYLCLVYEWCEVDAGSFLGWLSPWILDGGQVDCLIPKLNTISIWLGCQLDWPDYKALTEMVLSCCSVVRNTNDGGNICGPIERIRRLEVLGRQVRVRQMTQCLTKKSLRYLLHFRE